MEPPNPRAKDIFLEASDLTGDEREAFVARQCGNDASLAARVNALLHAHDEGSAIDRRIAGTAEAAVQLSDPDRSLEGLRTELADRFEILEEAGAGGMAIVYRAHDRKHNRDVALKVLRPDLARTVGSDRFLREIRVAAGLQHPNIVPLYDSGEANGLLYYVMPYLEGPTLKDLVANEGPLSFERASRIASEIADALDYAHERGVVHRDIKPGNIMFANEQAVVADFGLATALESSGDPRLTECGVAMGTPAYMSPEQAQGRDDVDRRSDVYSLGCVVYEMLAGHPPFAGGSAQAILARHISDPVAPVATVRSGLPNGIDETVAMALAKVPADRYETANAFVSALATPRTDSAHKAILWKAFAAVAVIAAILAAWQPWGKTTVLVPGDSIPLTFEAGPEFAGSVSPNGEWIVFSHTEHGTMDLFLKHREADRAERITDDAGDETLPRWSRDGSQIAYVRGHGSETHIYTMSPKLRQPRLLVDTRVPYLDSFWDALVALGSRPFSLDDNNLLFSKRLESGRIAICSIDLTTLEERQISSPEKGDIDLGASWSTDGTQIVFQRVANANSSLWLMKPGGKEELLLGDEFINTHASFLPGDQFVVFTSNRNGSDKLWSLHIESGQLTRLTSGHDRDWYLSVSDQGEVIYSAWSHQTDIHRLNLASGESERLTRWSGDNFTPRYSPDGKYIAYESTRTGNWEIWILDLETRKEFNLTSDAGSDYLPVWSPDGKEVAFLSNRGGDINLWAARADGTGKPERITEQSIRLPNVIWLVSLSVRYTPHGDAIGFVLPDAGGSALWLIHRDGQGLRKLRSNVRRFDWYQDDERIVYTTMVDDRLELRAAHLGTGADVLLHAGPHTDLILSPNGEAVAFLKSASHFDQHLFLLQLTPPQSDGLPRPSGEPERLTGGQGRWHVHNGGWSPDGAWIAYTQDTDDGDTYLLELKQE